MELDILNALNAERAARRAVILVSPLDGGSQRLVKKEEDWQSDALASTFETCFRTGKSTGTSSDSGEKLFLTVYLPPPRLIIIGAVHISKALVPMAQLAGLDVTVIDPREAFASEARFPEDVLVADWPEDALPQHGLDDYTALAAITHDPKIDDFPLMEALRSGCFYVGALGSRTTHSKRVARLTGAGLEAEQIARIHAPIGLDIGAVAPEEIAVAILAQVISCLRKGPEAS